MDVTLIYAIAFGALFGFIVVCRGIRLTLDFVASPARALERKPHRSNSLACAHRFILRNFVYPAFLSPRKWTRRWNLIDAILLVLYYGANATCVALSLNLRTASRRAGTLALVNMTLLFAGPHLSFIADILNMSLRQYKRMHAAAGAITMMLAAFHSVVAAVQGGKLKLSDPSDLYALIVSFRCQCSSMSALTPRLLGHSVVMRPARIIDAANVVIRTEPPNPSTFCICRNLCYLAP